MLPTPLRHSVLSGEITPTPVGDLGLRGRAGVYLIDDWCVSVIDRKSRFLRKDAHKFLEVLEAARGHVNAPISGHVIVRTAPVCRQAQRWLEEQNISLERL